MFLESNWKMAKTYLRFLKRINLTWLVFLIGFFANNGNIHGQRYRLIDLSSSVLPIDIDTIRLNQIFEIKVVIKNIGKDTFYKGEKIKLSPSFGGSISGTSTIAIRKNLHGEQGDTFTFSIRAFGYYSGNGLVCAWIQQVIPFPDSLIWEPYENPQNNRGCTPVYFDAGNSKTSIELSNSSLVLFPQPVISGNSIFIKGANIKEVDKIEIFNLNGQKIAIKEEELLIHDDKLEIKTVLNTGFYFLRLFDDKETLTYKLEVI